MRAHGCTCAHIHKSVYRYLYQQNPLLLTKTFNCRKKTLATSSVIESLVKYQRGYKTKQPKKYLLPDHDGQKGHAIISLRESQGHNLAKELELLYEKAFNQLSTILEQDIEPCQSLYRIEF